MYCVARSTSPALSDLLVFNPVKVDVDARFALVRTLSGYENEISLSEQELDLVDASVFNEFFQVTSEVIDSIANAGLMADAMISRKILRYLVVISCDVNGLVVFTDE